ncbi:pyridoxamine 5'-phosphate oxidase ['Osedax' symbiont bacterium Rs2_46_30_T18]|nr:pyridoxamine 5'-phosphate oxidase ['Osedax' symbiont bacterium Rs2_46_30_T18]
MENQTKDLTAIRREYCGVDFLRSQLSANPVQQFSNWFEQAREIRPDDVSSMTLATASASGMPSARIVLLKHYDEGGFCWYTDYESQKGQHIADNPQAELMFYWSSLERQVRIQGWVHKLDQASAKRYFNERPRSSQISAAASFQSQPIGSREELEGAVTQLQGRFANSEVLKPERWGGYCLVPSRFEFWQGREGRLHDRLVYTLTTNQWDIQRLQP